MAVSSVAVTEGSGKNLHTWQRSVSSVNREEQYVQFGEPALPTYSATALAVSTATTSSHLIQVMSAASTYLRVRRIWVSQIAAAGSTTRTTITLLRLTTAGTTGTAIGIAPYDWSDTPSATVLSLPSSKGTESDTVYRSGITLTTAPGAGTWTWEHNPYTKPLIIPTGTASGFCLSMGTGVASATVDITVEWTETAWL